MFGCPGSQKLSSCDMHKDDVTSSVSPVKEVVIKFTVELLLIGQQCLSDVGSVQRACARVCHFETCNHVTAESRSRHNVDRTASAEMSRNCIVTEELG